LELDGLHRRALPQANAVKVYMILEEAQRKVAYGSTPNRGLWVGTWKPIDLSKPAFHTAASKRFWGNFGWMTFSTLSIESPNRIKR